MLNSAYATSMQGLGTAFGRLGILDYEKARCAGKLHRWLHSLFAIYDVERLNRLDLPWWTLEAASIIDVFLQQRPRTRVFEYGAGASTLFLARRCENLVSVEHDSLWFAAIRGMLQSKKNVDLALVEPQTTAAEPEIQSQRKGWEGLDFSCYVESLLAQDGQFDLIVIDGRCRNACLEAALSKISSDGVILFDNADRKRYRPAIEACELARLWTRGMTACLPYPDSTLLFSPNPQTLRILS